MGYGGHMMYGYGWLLWLIILIFIGVTLYYVVARTRGAAPSGRSTSETALDILEKRFARGEISKDEFEEMKKDIGR